jgi:hypothetical protein
LLQQGIYLRHLVVRLLLPLGCILHVSIKCILGLTNADLQSSELGVDAVQLTMVQDRLSWLDWWW